MGEGSGKKILQWLTPVLLMTIVIVVMFFNFFIKIKMEGVRVNKKEMASVASIYGEKLHGDFNTIRAAGRTAAAILAEGQTENANVIQTALSVIMTHTESYEVIYHKGSGLGIRHDGSEVSLKETSYYEMVYQAADVRYLFAADDGITGQPAIILVVPLEDSSLQNVLLYYSVENVKEHLKMDTEFDSKAFAALISADGSIIAYNDIDTGFLTKDNLWKAIEDAAYANSVAGARVQIKNHTDGTLQAKVGQEERTLVYHPIGINDWALVIGINQDYVDERQNGHWKTTSTMLMELLLVLVASLGIIAVMNIVSKKKEAEKDRQLREKADTDLLTGLNNKLATERKIKDYIAKNPNTLGMMFVLDIDNFKKINDTMGHAFGDEVLREFGNQIGAVFRVTDIIGRTGGDEFTIFLKFLKDDTNTLREAEKLVQFFKDFTTGEYVKYSPTASIGAAVFPAHGTDFDSLYKAADKALYKAKQRGKNQLAFYDDRDRVKEEE